MRKPISLLILLTIGLAVVAVGGSKSTSETAKTVPHITQQQPESMIDDPPGTIDGAKNPEKISDLMAYEVFLRFISENQTQEEKNSIRSYIRQAGLGCQKCFIKSGPGVKAPPEDAEIDALLAVAEAFRQRAGILDNQVKEIKDRKWPNPNLEVMAQLTNLQGKRESLVAEVMASLPHRLGRSSAQKISQHINERVKHKMKIVPGPQSAPGGPEWQDHMSDHH